MIKANYVVNDNCLNFLQEIPDESIDLIITDPPYGISSGKKLFMQNTESLPGFGGDWSIIDETWDSFGIEEYEALIQTVFYQSYRVLKPQGSIFVFGTYHNMGILNYYAIKSNFHLINEIIWYKRNAFPNLSQKCLTASHENILWLGRSKTWNFNYDISKEGNYAYDNLKEPNKQMRSVWDIPNNKQKDDLSYKDVFTNKAFWVKSQKPLRLIERCIDISAKPGDIVADWFAGSGTTLVAAKKKGYSYLGCEINPNFYEVIQWRLDQISSKI